MTTEEDMDRYGNQFATRVEKNVEVGTISADIIYTPSGMYSIAVGGVILGVQYICQDDAVASAEVLLDRLAEGELAVAVLPMEGYAEERNEECYYGEPLPVGWDAADHKAMYE